MLRSMLLKILPKSMEEEILDRGSKPDVRSYLDVIAWVKRKTTLARTKELSEHARKQPQSSAHRKSLQEQEMDARLAQAAFLDRLDYGNNDEAPQIQHGQPTPTAAASSTTPVTTASLMAFKAEMIAAINARPKAKAKARVRSPSPGRRARIQFEGCWHCGAKDHSRTGGRDGKGKKCPIFAKLLSDANPGVTDRKKMKLPVGYEGKYEKALKAAGIPTKKIQMLDDEDFDDSDSDDEPHEPDRVCALRQSKPTSALDDEFPLPDGPWPCANRRHSCCPKTVSFSNTWCTCSEACQCGEGQWVQEQRQILEQHGMSDVPLLGRPAKDVIAMAQSAPNAKDVINMSKAPPRAQTETKNRYASLADDSTFLDDDTIKALNGWATVVNKKPKKTGKKVPLPPSKPLDVFETCVVRNEQQLDELLRRNPRLAALPESTRKIKEKLKSTPV